MSLELLLGNLVIYVGIILAFLSSIFLLALYKKDNSIMDIAYGPTFAITGIALLLLTQTTALLALVVVGCITLWATRLSTRIYRKNAGRPEDQRYAAWRNEWLERGKLYFILRSYAQIYLLQGSIIAIVGLPMVLAISFTNEVQLLWLTIGVSIFAAGLIYETIADMQLDTFLKQKRAGTTDEDLMKTGLFRYSRRPNYFGEATIWTGLAVIVLPVSYGWLAVLSPIMITYIVTMVTGPMLERIFLKQYPEQYQAYMRTTSYFIPWPPKS